MLQFPAFMIQYPWATRTIPTSLLLPSQWPQPHSEELLLAMEESDFDEKTLDLVDYRSQGGFLDFHALREEFDVLKGGEIMRCPDRQFQVPRYDSQSYTSSACSLMCNEIRKTNSSLVVMGRTTADNEKEEYDNEADDDDADNAEESEGEEFEQETA
ncbi:hypothetical protein CJ030_MR4G023319 [Morella rubra]|uniref:Uncharacterized protein n=1 Tax=Morella rubra TaxID=262757 RepID=A0A6A1VVU3_9ROSI|nr:hypothetical protein CJ030_MR4G023319 [Morella rubra]